MVRFMEYPLIMPVSMYGMFQSVVARQHGDHTTKAIVPLKSPGDVYGG